MHFADADALYKLLNRIEKASKAEKSGERELYKEMCSVQSRVAETCFMYIYTVLSL
jgi:hypothetical protein